MNGVESANKFKNVIIKMVENDPITKDNCVEYINFKTIMTDIIEEITKPAFLISMNKVGYAIGIPDKNGGFGMTHGPVNSIKEVIDITPEDPTSVIISFESNGEQVLYTWNQNNQVWESIPKKEQSVNG